MTKYIIVGSDNFWYALCDTSKEVEEEIKKIKTGITGYANPETNEFQRELPDTLYIYEIAKATPKEIDLSLT